MSPRTQTIGYDGVMLSPSNHRESWQLLRSCWSVSQLVLLLTTIKLWFPQSVFPQVPLSDLGLLCPAWTQTIAALALFGSLIVTLPVRRFKRYQIAGMLTYIVSMAFLFLTDQHRLQPWAYQFFLMGIVLVTCESARAIELIRLLVISIYVYSAISKMDYQFYHTTGLDLIGTILGFIGLDINNFVDPMKTYLISVLPATEFIAAGLLCFSRTRKTGILVASLMHFGLFVVLGPLGLGHMPGVLMWNLAFIVLLISLFAVEVPLRRRAKSGDAQVSMIGTIAVMIAVALPVAESLGRCDHWLAWGLYSPRNSRVVFEVHDRYLVNLPAEITISKTSNDGGFTTLNLDTWSLSQLWAPNYPQARFQLGVARYLVEKYELQGGFRMYVLGMSNRMNGSRDSIQIATLDRLKNVANRYSVNSKPRMESP